MTVTALYADEGKKKGTTEFVVCARQGDMVQRTRFATRDEAIAFAASITPEFTPREATA